MNYVIKKIIMEVLDFPFLLWRYRDLVLQHIKREVVSRYRGSYLGFLWSYITPLFMLTIYTFVFGVVFKTRWGVQHESTGEFSLLLFCGLLTYNLFAEVIVRSVVLIVSNANYVKKVVFPIEVLPVITIGTSLVNLGFGMVILLIGNAFFTGAIQWTFCFLPVVLFPFVLFILGFSWFLASLGVYLRDINQLVGLITQALMFMSPIFYPVSSIPRSLRFIFYLNPLTYVVEDMRRIIIWGSLPHWDWILYEFAAGFMVSLMGYVWFRKTKGGFADVL